MFAPFKRIVAGLAALLLTACSAQQNDVYPTQSVVRLSPSFTGEFSLTDLQGNPVTQDDFGEKIRLIYFGFTMCPDVCPIDFGVMSGALNALGDDAQAVAPIFITIDPQRDTPQRIADFFAFDERVIGLTGSDEALADARDAFKVFAQIVPLPDSALNYTVDHTRFFFIVDEKAQPQLAVIGGVNAQELAAVVRRSITDM
ncbi:MAG: SCO family protein [Pseudomonadota bacterium]